MEAAGRSDWAKLKGEREKVAVHAALQLQPLPQGGTIVPQVTHNDPCITVHVSESEPGVVGCVGASAHEGIVGKR